MKKIIPATVLSFFLFTICAAADISFNSVAGTCGMTRFDISSERIEYRDKNTKLLFVPPKREIFFNNIRIIPGFAPEKKLTRRRWYLRKENDIFINSSDWYSTIRPLLNPAIVPYHRIATVTLDAGHGGNDTGALGKISKEKDINLKITLRTAAILRACGYRVLLTRTNDQTVPLKNRSDIQKKHKSDLFISIHVNAVKNSTIRGIETYALTPENAPSTNGKPKLERHPANIRDTNNFLLAYTLQKALLSRTGAADRGVKRARFAVLRDITAPGALIEVGFISNSADEKLLNSAAYIEKLSRAVAEGILTYHRTVYKYGRKQRR